MYQRIRTMLTSLFARRPERQPATAPDGLDAALGDHQRALQIRWWYWRHCFLELKRLQLEAHTDRSDA